LSIRGDYVATTHTTSFAGSINASGALRVAGFANVAFVGGPGSAFDFTGMRIDLEPSSGLNVNGGAIVEASTVANDGFVFVNGGTLNVTHVRGAGRVTVSEGQRFAIRAGGGSGGTSSVGTIVTNGTGAFDFNDHDLAIDYNGASPIGNVRTRIASGYAAGGWTGGGLTSSAAATAAATPDKTGLGYAEASGLFTAFPADIGGGVIVDNTAVVVRYTLVGDATLDRMVNIGDFSRMAANFNAAGLWPQGDFNYDNQVNIGDFSLLAANFNKTLSADPARGGTVPEPAMLWLIASLTLIGRRRSRPL
jgi:hypothetical protein